MLDSLKGYVPKRVKEPLKRFLLAQKDLRNFLRTQKFITAWAGPVYERSRDLIEIDITYACNLKCFSCNRSCGLAPSDDHLSLDQIQKFIRESTAKGVHWRRLRILGGEPTLHPEFLRILDYLLAFKMSQCPDATIEVVTNGLGKKVNEVLAKIKDDVVVRNTGKKSREQNFRPFNLAPRDFARSRYSDFSCGCWVLSDCGMGLSPYGYYQCAVAAAVDRVFGFDIGRKSLPDLADSMRNQMKILCGYCGNFMTIGKMFIDKDLMSESWRKAYENYKIAKPQMTFY